MRTIQDDKALQVVAPGSQHTNSPLGVRQAIDLNFRYHLIDRIAAINLTVLASHLRTDGLVLNQPCVKAFVQADEVIADVDEGGKALEQLHHPPLNLINVFGDLRLLGRHRHSLQDGEQAGGKDKDVVLAEGVLQQLRIPRHRQSAFNRDEQR